MWLELDFVLVDYKCVVVVVSCDICCCYASSDHGDILVPKMMCVVCASVLCRVEGWCGCDHLCCLCCSYGRIC